MFTVSSVTALILSTGSRSEFTYAALHRRRVPRAQRCFIPMKHCADAEADGDGDGCMFAGGCPRCGRLRRRPSSGRRCGVIHDDKCRFGHCAAGKHLDVIDGSSGFAEMDEWITSGWSRNSERRGLPEREPV
jgi:hypothetical protein